MDLDAEVLMDVRWEMDGGVDIVGVDGDDGRRRLVDGEVARSKDRSSSPHVYTRDQTSVDGCEEERRRLVAGMQ